MLSKGEPRFFDMRNMLRDEVDTCSAIIKIDVQWRNFIGDNRNWRGRTIIFATKQSYLEAKLFVSFTRDFT